MREIGGIITAPAETFLLLSATPRWKLAAAVVTSGLTALAWLKTCFDKGALTFDLVLWGILFLCLFAMLMLVSLFLASFLFLSLRFFTGLTHPDFRVLFAVSIHTGLIFLLGEVANLVLVRLSILDPSSFPVPHRFPLGLDAFFIGTHVSLVLAVVLYSINMFTVWYFMVLSIGISAATGLRRRSCVAIASSAWFLGVVFVVSFVLAIGGSSIGVVL